MILTLLLSGCASAGSSRDPCPDAWVPVAALADEIDRVIDSNPGALKDAPLPAVLLVDQILGAVEGARRAVPAPLGEGVATVAPGR